MRKLIIVVWLLCLLIIFGIVSLAMVAELTFTYIPLEEEEIVSVSLRGSFNSWSE
jgi:hypothetical protein